MLDKKELMQVRDYVIEILPELLRREPEIVRAIDHIIAEQFPRRDEFARLLDKMDQRDEEIRQQHEESNDRLDMLREDLDMLRGEMNQRLDDQQKVLLGVRRDVTQLRQEPESLTKRMEAHEKWIRLRVGEIGNEKGQSAEDFFAEGLRYGLKNPNISADKIRLRQPLVDTEGVVFKQPFASEVDLISDNDHLIVFEIKSGRVKAGDVSFFSLKVEVVAAQNPDKQVRGVLIVLFASDNVRQRCLELGVELIE
jgi:hypothetical protein